MKTTLHLILAALILLTLPLHGKEGFEAFLQNHCIRCHGPEKEKGDTRVDTLSRDFKSGLDSHLWAEVIERINAGEMPPEDEPQPSEVEISQVIQQLDDLIRQGRDARLAARPPVAHYRLSRQEYRNTVYDLLGVRYDPAKPGELNADPLWHGFERIGSRLSLSPSHVERYYKAAETVVSRAFPETPVEPKTVRKTAAELRYQGGENQQAYLDRFGIKRPLRSVLFPGRLQPALRHNWFGKTGPQHSGLYRVKMQASGIRPSGGQVPHLRIGQRTFEAANEGLVELDILAPEDKPEIIEFEVFLEMPVNLDFNVIATEVIDRRKGAHYRNALASQNYMFTHSTETALLNPVAPKMFDEEGNGIYSMVLLDWIEWEGPIVSQTEQNTRKGIIPANDASPESVAQHLQSFANRAWRRPVSNQELKPYLKLYDQEREVGESVNTAYQAALLGILTSRNFTYLVEGDTKPRERLNDWELASRLSYFLWSSMPDPSLLAAAEKGQLTSENLATQVERMLADPKIERFMADFPRQWLQLHKLGMFPPDKKLYPSYDAWLEASMQKEVIHYFKEIFTNNLPIDQFIQSDWTVANPRLSEFYGLPESAKGGFQKVSLTPDSNRGGLLTTGAILGLTSDGTRHRPVHRGVWISEAIFGKTPPAPPANVDPIETNPVGGLKTTIRQKLEAHTHDANCAACHKTIDPLGFAFDQFDAIGQFRTHEKVETGKGENPVSDPSGELPDGRAFANANDFKQLLVNDRDRFARAMVEHLCTYSLRRVLTVDDADDIEAIVAVAKESNYRLKDLVKAVATSELLKKK